MTKHPWTRPGGGAASSLVMPVRVPDVSINPVMSSLHLIPYLGHRQGGPVSSLAGLVGGLVASGCAAAVGSVRRDDDGGPVPLDGRVGLMHSPSSLGRRFRWSRSLRRWAAAHPADVIHSHGVWTDVSRLAGQQARRRGAPHVLAPCGMLGPAGYSRGRLKKMQKRLCRLMFQDRVLSEAACVHAKSLRELAELREFGVRGPVAVVPNPVQRPPGDAPVDPGAFRRRFGLDEDTRLALYVGRLTPVKGVERLVDAWAGLGRAAERWRLVLAGPDEGGYRDVLRRRAAALGCASSVTFTGLLTGGATWSAYAAAELFVMPSRSENFGSAIAEALTAGRPVIATTGTPWPELRDEACGWWVEPDLDALREALTNALTCDPDALAARGRAARRVAERFAPPAVAATMIEVYRWVLGRGPRPDCVYVNSASADD